MCSRHIGGRGAGTLLMRVALEELRDLGLGEAILWVLRDNLRARGFYERLGWYQDGRTTTEEYGGIELEALCYRRGGGEGVSGLPILEKPDLQDEKLIACLQDAYGLHAEYITFLPLGADVNTAVYRAVADDTTAYFVKLRRGTFGEMSVALPKRSRTSRIRR